MDCDTFICPTLKVIEGVHKHPSEDGAATMAHIMVVVGLDSGEEPVNVLKPSWTMSQSKFELRSVQSQSRQAKL